jgi:hypothetical protein
VLLEHIAHNEAVERYSPGDQFPNGGVTMLEAKIARIQPGGLHSNVRLGDEILITIENLEGGCLARRVPIKCEDHLAVERVMVSHQPTQQSCMIITESGTARRHRSVDPGQMGGHHIGIALHDHSLALLADGNSG